MRSGRVDPDHGFDHQGRRPRGRRCDRRLGVARPGEFALEVPLKAVFFNDAGVDKEDAGIVALAMLQSKGVAAGTVAHTSARIGDAQDTWESGVISYVNEAARTLGLDPGQALCTALKRLAAG